tara:strand:+ start:136 stop:723 length:588 start_codon:yes stop_codon:yes gene_type:complete
MKKLLTILTLSFCLAIPSQADDIKDFQIEGISIGDSLLKYYKESEIKNLKKTNYPKSDKFYLLDGIETKNQKEYEVLSFHLKKNDKQYIIHSISAGIFYRKNFNDCLIKKKEIVDQIKSRYKKLKLNEYDFKYKIDDLKSIAYVSDLDLKDDSSLRVWCVNWSKVTEKKRNFVDNLSVAISPNYFSKWLTEEANQ